jgi:hypothetical protein
MFLGSKARPVRKADNLTAICESTVGSSTSHNPIGLHGLWTQATELVSLYRDTASSYGL